MTISKEELDLAPAVREFGEDYDLDLSWLDTRGEWGIKAEPSKTGSVDTRFDPKPIYGYRMLMYFMKNLFKDSGVLLLMFHGTQSNPCQMILKELNAS